MSEIPDYVIETLALVRRSNKVNMMDRMGVITLCHIADPRTAAWLTENLNRYTDALNEMGRQVSRNRSAE